MAGKVADSGISGRRKNTSCTDSFSPCGGCFFIYARFRLCIGRLLHGGTWLLSRSVVFIHGFRQVFLMGDLFCFLPHLPLMERFFVLPLVLFALCCCQAGLRAALIWSSLLFSRGFSDLSTKPGDSCDGNDAPVRDRSRDPALKERGAAAEFSFCSGLCSAGLAHETLQQFQTLFRVAGVHDGSAGVDEGIQGLALQSLDAGVHGLVSHVEALLADIQR